MEETTGGRRQEMKTAYMIATWKEYQFENLINDHFAYNEDGIKTIITDDYKETYSAEVDNFSFDWQNLEVKFSVKKPWDDEAEEEKIYIVPIYKKEEEQKMKWQETALEIVKEAFDQYKDNEEEAINFIWESVDGCGSVIYTTEAYETVNDARITDYETFEEANEELIEMGSNQIGKGETIDDLITRLAFLIVNRKAINYYYSLLKEKVDKEEVKEAH